MLLVETTDAATQANEKRTTELITLTSIVAYTGLDYSSKYRYSTLQVQGTATKQTATLAGSAVFS